MHRRNAAHAWQRDSASDDIFDESFARRIMEHLPHPIFVKNHEFRYVLVNEAFAALAQTTPSAMVGATDHDFFVPSLADACRSKDEETFSSGIENCVHDEPFLTKEGGTKVITTCRVPMRDPNGRVTHLVGIMHDITLLKESEQALRDANDELERRVTDRTKALEAAQEELLRKERLAVMGHLAGGLAHEIRNPLATISNALYVLRRLLGNDPDSQVLATLEIIREEMQQANAVIRDLVDYARIRPPTRVATQLSDFLRDARIHAGLPKEVSVVYRLETDASLEVDPDQMRTVLANLVQNAAHAMAGRGQLTFTAHRDGDFVVVGVEDAGPGVSPEVAAKLFEPLVTTKMAGLGLGLTTARALVENQHGTLTVAERAPGMGARFEMRLPAHLAEGKRP